jgi:hypothetical protein
MSLELAEYNIIKISLCVMAEEERRLLSYVDSE